LQIIDQATQGGTSIDWRPFKLTGTYEHSKEAFNYIPTVLEVLFKLDDDYLVWETLYFLIHLYSSADNTQIHPFLESNRSVLTNHIKKFNDAYATPFKELEHYLKIRK